MSAEETMIRAVREAGVDVPARYEEVTESSNATALRLAEEGAPEWTVVVAGHQTAGRGRLGRTWLSEPGAALLCSIVLRPRMKAASAGSITLLAGVAMAEAARVSCEVEVRCKWPNDLMVGERKAGGILAESVFDGDEMRHVVVGAGVNVRSAPQGVPDATALGRGDPSVLLQAFLFCLKQRYTRDDPPGEDLLDAYRLVSATIGRRVRATTLSGEIVEGDATGVDAFGNLLVGGEVVGFGEVAHIDR